MRQILWFWIALATFACSDGGGCDGLPVAPYPEPPPAGGEIQEDVARTRITQNALNFLSQNLDLILEASLTEFLTVDGDEVVFVLDEALIPPETPVQFSDGCLGEPDPTDPADCTQPTHPSKISFKMSELSEALSLSWLENDAEGRPGIRFSLQDFQVFLDMGIFLSLDTGDINLGSAACLIQDTGELAAIQIEDLSFELRLRLNNDGEFPTIESTIPTDPTTGEPAVTLLLAQGADDTRFEQLQITPCSGGEQSCSDPRCLSDLEACEAICGLADLFTELGGFATAVLNPVLDSVDGILAEQISDLLVNALAAIPLELALQLNMSELIESPVLAHTAPFNVLVTPSENFLVDGVGNATGMSIGANGGAATIEPAACALNAIPPELESLRGTPPEYTGFIEVINDEGEGHIESYHAAASISEALLTQVGYGAYLSGLVCLDIDSALVEELSGGSFALTAGLLSSFDVSLQDIVDPDAPLLIQIRPTKVPIVRVGAGGAVANGVDESLIEAVIDNVQLGIFVLVDEALVRLSVIQADLSVSLDLGRAPSGGLELQIAEIAFANSETIYSELTPNVDLGEILELAIDLVLGNFIGDSFNFDFDLDQTLQDALGLSLGLVINEVRRDLGPSASRYLSLYATLCESSAQEDPSNPTCFLGTPTIPENRSFGFALAQPRFEDKFDAVPQDFAERERFFGLPKSQVDFPFVALNLPNNPVYQARVDGGAWSSFRGIKSEDQSLRVDSPRLRMMGEHRVEIRIQEYDLPKTRVALEPVTFHNDAERPHIWLEKVGAQFEVQAYDAGSPTDLQIFAQGSNGQFEVDGPIDANAANAPGFVFAVDRFGNQSQKLILPKNTVEENDLNPKKPLNVKEAVAGCSSNDRSSPSMVICSLCAMFASFFLFRRSRRRLES